MDALVRLTELFDTLPNMTIGGNSFDVRFDLGTQKDLNKWLSVNKDKSKYPLVWLITPISTDENKANVTGNFTLVLATLNDDVDMGNRDRLNRAFKDVLNPLYNNVIKALERGTSIDFVSNEKTVTDYFNYSEDDVSHETTEIWDAKKLELSISINNNCLKTIYYG